MYLGWRDLRVAKGRFVLIGSVIGLVALLSTLLSGLANGLVDDGISGLRALPLTHLAFQEGAESAFGRSVLTPETVAGFDAVEDLETTAIGVSFFNAARDRGATIDIALFGLEPEGFLGRSAIDGAELMGDGLVLSDRLRDEVEVGDELTLLGTDRALPVVGFTEGGTYGHVPIAFTTLPTWQHLVYGEDHRGRVSAVAIHAGDGADLSAVAALDAELGTETVTKEESFAGSPGFSAETATMTLIRGFLLVISALVVGAFFTVWTVQRTRQIGLLKAMGASNGYVVRDALGQLTVVMLAAIAAGTAIGLGIGALISDDAPFTFSTGSVLFSAAALLVAGLLGSLVALRRLTGVDPAISMAVES